MGEEMNTADIPVSRSWLDYSSIISRY